MDDKNYKGARVAVEISNWQTTAVNMGEGFTLDRNVEK